MANIYELITNFTEAIHTHAMTRRAEALQWKEREKNARSNMVRKMFHTMSVKATKDAEDLLGSTGSREDTPIDHREN